MELSRLSIHQTNAQIGVQTQPSSFDVQKQDGFMSIEQPSAKMEIHSHLGELSIDSSAAWAALGKGSNLEWSSSIYSQGKNIALQAIAKTVERGHRMAQITNPQNPFAEFAKEDLKQRDPVEYAGSPSYSNVKVHYEARSPDINIEPQKTEIQYTPTKLDVQYRPGSVEVYLKQKNSIDIDVSPYNWYK
ncbi:DUF6470 family protein [Paenibacillus aestuarii]|uniref:DUF6470 family protein n=1 Tax=Paenibacillus aestuarii TaxID=516965 RepID=A0ABW0K6D1_9BACL|nr:DUF6470 family protein [Paenibacillus aestuarii]